LGGASSNDVEALIEKIQSTVKKDHGVMLEPEVIVLGEK
jgi:UDP-N-acetylenolpyruvoylglucosamine reductase